MRASVSVTVLLSCLVGLSTATPASAQTFLERLEKRIRNRSGQADRPAKPADTKAPATPKATVAEKPLATSEVINKEPAYLGLVADDRQDRGRGVRVLQVRPASPAEKGGLRPQDLITGIGGVRVRQMSEMADAIEAYRAGDLVSFEVVRGDRPQELKVTLGRRPTATPLTELPPANPEAATGPPAPRTEVPSTTPPPPAVVPLEAPPASPATSPPPPPAAGPELTAPGETIAAAPKLDEIQQLRQRIELLERRVAELERALSQSQKKP